jgi:hypothetical protein
MVRQLSSLVKIIVTARAVGSTNFLDISNTAQLAAIGGFLLWGGAYSREMSDAISFSSISNDVFTKHVVDIPACPGQSFAKRSSVMYQHLLGQYSRL